MRRTSPLLLAIAFFGGLTWSPVHAAQKSQESPKPPLVEEYLIEGKLAEGEAALQDELAKNPEDDEVRFGLGAVQFLRGVEELMQTLYHYGLHSQPAWALPIVRLPVPDNPEPETITYTDARRMLDTFIEALRRTETTLSGVTDPDVKLPLRFGKIRLDFNGDGQADDNEALWVIYAKLAPQVRVTAEAAEEFIMAFDRGDVHWLRGYCDLLSVLCEMVLAYDWKEVFEHTAPMVYAKPETPFPFLLRQPDDRGRSNEGFSDAIALIHLLKLEVVEPNRMLRALDHLQAMISQSRESWKHILVETDNDHEWIPNPDQTGPIPNLRVTRQIVDGWLSFLDEAEAILAGEKLIPFWRGNEQRGVNLRRVFTEPTRFDLVLWVQGTAAVPYLEEGPKTQADFWWRTWRLFQGRFLTFAVWFN